MFKKILVPKTQKEKMKLQAIKKTLKGIINEEKNYELHGNWELGNVMISKDYLERRFGSIKEAAKNLSDKIKMTSITNEELKRLDNELDFEVRKVYLDEITSTFHGKYADHLGISISRAERLSQILKLERQNPEYYSKNLKDPNFVKKDADPIIIYFKDNEGTILEGNNRILKMKCDMASELSRTDDPNKQKQIREKYAFYAKTKDMNDLEKAKRR